MRRRTKAIIASVGVLLAVVFFVLPIVPGIQGDCIYYPDEHQSLSFRMFGVGTTYAYGQFSWT